MPCLPTSTVGVGLHSTMAGFLGANEVLFDGTSRYILVLALFAPANSLMVFFGFMERLVEKPHIYLIATVFCLVCNIFLNYLFIKILYFGVSGAALATGLSYLIGLFIVAPPFLTRKTVVNIHEGHFCQRILKKIIFNGSSEGVNYLAAALVLYLFNKTFIRFAGKDGVAAFTVITTTVMFGISDGIGSIISCNFVAGKTDRVQKALHMAFIINFMIGIFVFVLLHTSQCIDFRNDSCKQGNYFYDHWDCCIAIYFGAERSLAYCSICRNHDCCLLFYYKLSKR